MTEHEQHPLKQMPAEIPVREGVDLRLLTPEDGERMYEIFQADPTIQDRVSWTHGLTSERHVSMMIAMIQRTSARYAITKEDSVPGYIGMWEDTAGYMSGVPAPGEFGFGYFLDPAERGQGLVTDAARALMKTAEATFDVKSWGLWAEDDNAESLAILQKLGFTRTEQVCEEPKMHAMERRWERAPGHHE